MSASTLPSRVGEGLLNEAAAAIRPRTIVISLAFILAYIAADRIGFMLTPTAALRPGDMAGGIALALLVWGGLRFAPAVLHIPKDGVDFLLRKLVVQIRSPGSGC